MLAHIERGHGTRPVVLLHGFLGSGRNLASLARRWAERDGSLRLILPDLPGHGASPPLPHGADLEMVARHVVQLVEGLGIRGPVDLVGHSLGGRVALLVRDVAPAAVAAVVLLDIPVGPIPADAAELEDVLALLLAAPASAPGRDAMRAYFAGRGLAPGLTDWMLMNLAARPDGMVAWRIDREALAAFHQRIRHADLWPVLRRAGTKTRCIRGGRSPLVSEAEAARLSAAGVAVETIPGAGHFVHIDAQDALLGLLSR